MRRRLTVAIVAVVIGTLLVTAGGSLLLVRRASSSTARSEITQEAVIVGQRLSEGTLASEIGARGRVNAIRVLEALQVVGSYDFFRPVGLTPSGRFQSLPAPLGNSLTEARALQNDLTVSGAVGNVVFAAVPVVLSARQRTNLGIPAGDEPVLLATRTVRSPVNGLVYFLLVAGAALVVAVAVAEVLARRISIPLVRAVATTVRMAHGDLAARVAVGAHDYPELTELAGAINSMGDSLNRARRLERQFLLSVSHELRTPLTSIRGYADAIADGATDDVAGAVGVIGTEAKRLERLVQDLLDLARLDARQFTFAMRSIDCVAVAAGTADGFRPEAAALGIDLVAALPTEALWVDADPDRLSQVAANLVENALRFARRRVVIGVTGWESSTALWVVDDGPGIPSGDLPRVFERHFTSARAGARSFGSGLGLAIVEELVAGMGAAVRAESPIADGSGSRFTVWLRPSAPAASTSHVTATAVHNEDLS